MNAYFFKMTNEERQNILDKHKHVYDGYATNYGTQPKQQPLYVQDFANDKDGMTVNNQGVIKPYTNMGINESTINEIDANTGSVYVPEVSFDFGGPKLRDEDGDDEISYVSLGSEIKKDEIGDSPTDMKHGTMESELDELFDDENVKSRFVDDYNFNEKEFGKKINMPRLKLGLDKIDRVDDMEKPYKHRHKPEFDDTDLEFVDEEESLEESQKESLKQQISESLDMFKRFNKY